MSSDPNKEVLRLLAEISDKIGNSSSSNRTKSRYSRYFDDDDTSIAAKYYRIKIGLDNLYNSVTNLNDAFASVEDAASKMAKSVALTATGMRKLSNETLKNYTRSKIGINYNISAEDLINLQSNYTKSVGRNVRLSNTDQENMAAMNAIMGSGSVDLAAQFENFGLSMSSTSEHVGKMFAEASEAGISFEKYSENVKQNISIAQNYTFKDGLKGLESMAKKATAIKMDMQMVANFAEKVSTVEGAIDVGAKLQVLGGPFAQMADPMGMLNEGLNDIEGLQDRVTKMVGGMGSFNKSTGQVEVSAFNKARIREAANAMGMDYGRLMESVNAQAKQRETKNQIAASANASRLDDKMKELVTNNAEYKNGKAGVSINGEWKSIDEISNKDYEALRKETQGQAADVKDIAKNLRSLLDIRSGAKNQVKGAEARLTQGSGYVEKWVTQVVGPGIVFALLGRVIPNLFNIGGYFKDLFKRDKDKGPSANWGGGGGKSGHVFSRGGKKLSTANGKVYKEIGGKLFNANGKRISGAAEAAVRKSAGSLGKVGKAAKATKAAKVVNTVGKVGKVGGAMSKLGTAANVLTKVGPLLTSPVGLAAMGVAAVGAGIHRTVKLTQKVRNKKREQLGLDDLKGKYSVKELGEINKAKLTGKISNKLKDKIAKNGDNAIYEEIEKKSKEKGVETGIGKGESIKKKTEHFGVANFTVGVANFNGGFGGRGVGGSIMGTSPLGLAAKGIRALKGTAETGVSVLKGAKENGLSGGWEAIKSKKNEGAASAFERSRENSYKASSVRDFNININGSLKLTGSNGQAVDIIEEIRRDPSLKHKLAEMIANEIEFASKGTNSGNNTLGGKIS